MSAEATILALGQQLLRRISNYSQLRHLLNKETLGLLREMPVELLIRRENRYQALDLDRIHAKQ